MPLKRKQQSFNSTFKPRTSGLASGGRLATCSAKKRVADAAKRTAYKEVDAGSNGCCFTCRRWAELQHSHVLPQGMNQLLKAVPANIVLECPTCHLLWGEKLPEYARRYPEALAAKVALMKQVNRQRWAFWMLKNEHLLAR
jgi:hypothetical protein